MNDFDELQASQRQKRLFFALCRQLNLDSNTIKEAVKRKYRLESFANISIIQLSEIIERMIAKLKLLEGNTRI